MKKLILFQATYIDQEFYEMQCYGGSSKLGAPIPPWDRLESPVPHDYLHYLVHNRSMNYEYYRIMAEDLVDAARILKQIRDAKKEP